MRLAPTVWVSDTADVGELRAALRAAGFRISRASKVTATVLDTIDGRLHVNGLRLVATQADELTLTLSGPAFSAGSITSHALPSRANELPSGPWRDAVEAATGERLLLAQVTMTAARSVASLSNASGELRSLLTIDDKLRLVGRGKPLATIVTVHRVAGESRQKR